MDIIITYFCGVDNGESSFCKIKDTQFIFLHTVKLPIFQNNQISIKVNQIY
jgi:hypothetical protein